MAISPIDVDNDFNITGGTFAAGNFIHTVEGDIDQTGGFMTGDTSEFILEGTAGAFIRMAPGSSFNHLKIDKNAGSAINVNFLTPIEVKGDLNINNISVINFMSINAGTYTHNVGGNMSVTSSWTNFLMTTGTFRFNGGTPQTINVPQVPYNFYDFTVAGTSVSVSADLSITGSLWIEAGEFVPGNFIHTLTGDFLMSPSTEFDSSTGTFDFNGSNQNISMVDPITNHFHEFRLGGGTVRALTEMSIGGKMSFMGPGQTFDPNNQQIRLQGDLELDQSDNLLQSGTFYFNGLSPQTITAITGSSVSFYSLVVDASSVSVNTGDLLDVNNNFALMNGTFTLGVFEHTFGGDWNESGTGFFRMTAGTITFDGSGNHNVTQLSGNNFFHLKAGGVGDITLLSDVYINGNFTHAGGVCQ